MSLPHDLLYHIEQVIAIDTNEKNYNYTNTFLFDFKEKKVIWSWNEQNDWVILKIVEERGNHGQLR